LYVQEGQITRKDHVKSPEVTLDVAQYTTDWFDELLYVRETEEKIDGGEIRPYTEIAMKARLAYYDPYDYAWYPLENMTVIAYARNPAGEEFTQTLTTGTDGWVEAWWVPVMEGIHTYWFEFGGTDYYAASKSDEKTAQVVKIRTSLTTKLWIYVDEEKKEVTSVAPGTTVYQSDTLKDEDGKPLVGFSVKCCHRDPDGTYHEVTVTTVEGGYYETYWVPTMIGKHTYWAEFAGTDLYAGCEKEAPLYVGVPPPIPITAIVVTAVSLIGLLGIAVMAKRGR